MFENDTMVWLLKLICTVTPASSSSEETHNTLKFAHRSKHVEIKASQNKVSLCEMLRMITTWHSDFMLVTFS